MNYKVFKPITIIVLLFFSWTFGGGLEVAYAATRTQSTEHRAQTKEQRPEEKFQKAIDEIGQAVQAVQTVQTSEEREKEKSKLKSKRLEIEGLDVEIRKQFKETEEKIKDLPEVIKQRHRDFVKKYEENLNTLKVNLDDIERARTKTEKEQAHRKAKEFLEKVKPPRKHTPLDPNNLPHRTVEPVEVPFEEISAEGFEKEQGQGAGVMGHGKPILVASNGSLDGLLTQNNNAVIPRLDRGIQSSGYPIETFGYDTSDLPGFQSPTPNPQSLTPEPILVAFIGSLAGLLSSTVVQATNPPTDADLAETIEIQFTPEITAKAEELQHNPVEIYEYVRNNFEYEPYYGSLKGAQQTLLEKAGNDFDQASLLIALLRASNIPARYVYGTVEIPIEKIMNWVGGITDPNTAAQILATAGVPGKLLTEGGKIKYAQMEHIWVEVYVPYGNYRGAIRDDSIKTWIPLDPSFKQYEYRNGMDLYSAMGINGEQYIQDYITDTSPSPIPAELQELFPNYSISPYQYYSKRLLNYMDTNLPDATIEDIIGDKTAELAKTIIKEEYPYLLGSLPYKIIAKGSTYSTIPENIRHKISFSIENILTYEIDLSYTVTLPEIAGKRITLSYIPATATDEALVVKYSGLLNVPPYLLNVKPVIKTNGVAVATGNPVGLGYEQIFNMSFRMPNKKMDAVTNKVTAGDYSAIAIQYDKTPVDVVGEKMQTLQNNVNSTDLDDLLGQMLYNIGISYMHHLNFEEELYAKNFQMIITKEPSEGMVISQAVTEWLWGVPYKITEGGIGIDVDRNIYVSFPIDGSQQRKKDFMIVSGIGSSAWEDMILQSFFNISSVSAAKLLKTASQQGIPIYTIDSNNINTILPQLQVSSEVINDIRNSVNAGKKVFISKTNIQYNDWNGVGYIVLDPVKGSGAFLISGGLAGGGTSKKPSVSLRNPFDLSAFITSFTRQAVIQIALAELDTPYIWGGAKPECGFDCSGLIHYVFTSVYSIHIWGGQRWWTVAGQHDYLQKERETYPYDYRLEGDIMWRRDYGHTGIVYYLYNSVIHASGKPCDKQDGSEGQETPEQCLVHGPNMKKYICGKLQRVVLTKIDEFGIPATDVGRPQP